jgi:hypothetical protein
MQGGIANREALNELQEQLESLEESVGGAEDAFVDIARREHLVD